MLSEQPQSPRAGPGSVLSPPVPGGSLAAPTRRTYSRISAGCEPSSSPMTMTPFSLTLPVNLGGDAGGLGAAPPVPPTLPLPGPVLPGPHSRHVEEQLRVLIALHELRGQERGGGGVGGSHRDPGTAQPRAPPPGPPPPGPAAPCRGLRAPPMRGRRGPRCRRAAR